MTKAEKQKQKDVDYFNTMKKSIIEDLADGRDISAIAGSIGRDEEWIREQLKSLYET